MHVRILTARHIQDAGVLRPLSVGQVCDVPAGVGAELIRVGVAEAVTRKAPESKPLVGMERKRA